MSEQINSGLSTYAQLVELRKELSAMKHRAEAAEARIKASQEQEPHGWRVPYEHSETNYIHGVPNKQTLDYWDSQDIGLEYVYAAPVIPPDVAELQRENAELRNAITRYMRDSKRLVLSNEELTKLLAEAKSKAAPEGWNPTDAELTVIYNRANGITSGKRPPISTAHIFTAMRAMLAAAPQPETDRGSNE